MNKNGFAPLIIIIILAMLGVVGYFAYKNSQVILPLPSPNSQTVTTKEYVTKGYAIKIDFPKLSFSYPSDWTVAEKATLGDSKNTPIEDITVAKNGYVVYINQELVTGAGACYFKDSPSIGELNFPGRDLQTVGYVEMDSNFGHLRYFRFPSVGDGTPTNSYGFCVKDTMIRPVNKDVYMVPSIGYISLDIPTNQNNVVFQEALDIVKSIKPLK